MNYVTIPVALCALKNASHIRSLVLVDYPCHSRQNSVNSMENAAGFISLPETEQQRLGAEVASFFL